MQVGNPDLRFKMMGIVGILKIVSKLGNENAIIKSSHSEVNLYFCLTFFVFAKVLNVIMHLACLHCLSLEVSGKPRVFFL